MPWTSLLVLLVLCCRAFTTNSLNSSLGEPSNEEEMIEAIRLCMFEMHMQYMQVLPLISEDELRLRKQLFDRVFIGLPEFQSGLIYNSTLDKTLKTLNLFCAQQWISNEYFDIARVNLEQSATFSKRTDGLMGQYMITGYIYLVDTMVDVHGPRSISWSFMFCKVLVNRIPLQRLTNNELLVLEKNMFYAPKRQWLDTTGPYRRVLHEKFIAYRQYLPRKWNVIPRMSSEN